MKDLVSHMTVENSLASFCEHLLLTKPIDSKSSCLLLTVNLHVRNEDELKVRIIQIKTA